MNIDAIRAEVRELNPTQRNAILHMGGYPDLLGPVTRATFASLTDRGFATYRFTPTSATKELTLAGRAAFEIIRQRLKEADNGGS